MIYSLTGKVTMLDENSIVVDTGSVSFEVNCSSFTVYELSGKPEKQTVLTYMQVREDAITLFGFKDKKEKLLFNDLIQVTGIGPKMAISILSGMPIADLVRAITSSDVKRLSSIKGLGKKTAERIVLELNNKLGGMDSLEDIMTDSTMFSGNVMAREIEEAVEVLVSTGIPRQQATEIAKKNYREGISGEELVVLCFKNSGR